MSSAQHDMFAGNPLEFFAERSLMLGRGLLLHVAIRDRQGERWFAQPSKFKLGVEGVYQEPAAQLSAEEAQGLMDELWRAGVRPSDIPEVGEKAATAKHLDDMRKIVAKKLGVEL